MARSPKWRVVIASKPLSTKDDNGKAEQKQAKKQESPAFADDAA
jgi:hypothetical protein